MARPPGDALLDRAFVEMRRPRLDRNTGRLEQSAAHLALRGKHERFGSEPERHQLAACRRRSVNSDITAAAVSSMERRVTSIIGQLCRSQSLRENAISSATAWRST